MKLALEHKIYIGFGLTLLFLIAIGVAAYRSTVQLVEVTKWEEQSFMLLSDLQDLLSHLQDVEIGVRGYVITGEESYLESYEAALKAIDQKIAKLGQLNTIDSHQLNHLYILKQLINWRLTVAKQLVDTRRNEGFDPAWRLVLTNKDRRPTNEVREIIDHMAEEQAALVQQRTAMKEVSVQQTKFIVPLASLLALVFSIIAIFVIHFDITQRKHLEEVLRESEVRFQTIFEEAAIGIGLTDMQGGLLTSNLALQKMLGYSATELQQMNIAQLTHPEDVNQTVKLHQELSHGERQNYQFEKRYLHKDGQVVWGRITASLVRDSQGRPLFNVGMIEDITEHKQAEETLAQERNLLRTLIDNLPDCVFFFFKRAGLYSPTQLWPNGLG